MSAQAIILYNKCADYTFKFLPNLPVAIELNKARTTCIITVTMMMTSWNGNIFRVTGPLWWESTGHRAILDPV